MAVERQKASTTENAKQQVQEKTQQVQEKAQEAAGTMRERMREQVGQRSAQAGEQIGSTAQALRSTSEKLREEGQDGPARAAERLAHHTERASAYLREADTDRILHDAEDFGRRRPLAVAGVGLLVGFAASRMLKASSRSRYEGSPESSGAASSGGAPYPAVG